MATPLLADETGKPHPAKEHGTFHQRMDAKLDAALSKAPAPILNKMPTVADVGKQVHRAQTWRAAVKDYGVPMGWVRSGQLITWDCPCRRLLCPCCRLLCPCWRLLSMCPRLQAPWLPCDLNAFGGA